MNGTTLTAGRLIPHPPQAAELPCRESVAARLLAAAEGVAVAGFDHLGGVASWAESCTRLWGYSGADCRDLTFRKLHGDAIAGELFPVETSGESIRPGYNYRLSGRTSTGNPMSVDTTFIAAAPDESPVSWWCLYRRVEGAAVRHDAPDRLRELLVNTIESLNNGLCLIDMSTNRIVLVNAAFVSITGFTRLEMQGNTFECLLAEWPAWRGHLLPQIEQLKRGGRSCGVAHWQVELPSGGKTLEVYGQPIFPPDVSPNFLLLIIDDATERYQLSNQLVQSEKLAAIGQLAAGIAHEIRSPLAAIQHAIYDLRSLVDLKNGDIREDIDIASEEIDRVQEIINNLLDFARESDTDPGPVNVGDVVEQTLRVIRKNFTNKNIRVTTRCEADAQAKIGANPLKQILINLFTNAAHAMSEGGELTVVVERRPGPAANAHGAPMPGTHCPSMSYGDDARERRRRRLAESTREHVVLRVTDTGCGISPDFLPMIFNPFFTTKPPGSGTGLGLSVVHSQVRDHGGAIHVSSQVGRGTTFTIKLPSPDTESFEG